MDHMVLLRWLVAAAQDATVLLSDLNRLDFIFLVLLKTTCASL